MNSNFAAFEPILALARDAKFWTDFFFITYPDHKYERIRNYDLIVPLPKLAPIVMKRCRLDFPVTEERSLVLDFTVSLDTFYLELLQSNGMQVEIGVDDEAHWHPHLLRWDELEFPEMDKDI
jgi:hypothetical protein